MPAADGLLRGIDRAAFAVALSGKLRRAGVPVGLTATEDFVRALTVSPPTSTSGLYWTARIGLIRRHEDLAAFDAVFAAAHAEPDRPTQPGRSDEDRYGSVPAATEPGVESGGGLPWATLPPAVDEAEDSDTELSIPQRRPSAAEALADRPFEDLDPDQLALLGDWLRDALRDWPARRSRRQVRDPAGHRIAMRATMARARRTGWEPIHLVRVRPVRRPRRVVMLADVSQSMQAQIPAFLLLMRALSEVAHAETFAFATALTRLTGATSADAVPDRFGGTRIASNIRALLASRHADVLRGAVVIIGSDGWDSDPPAELAVAMARLRRRAHTVIWLNPRAGVAGFRPEVAAMAAALPYCDELLPADTFRALRTAISSITSRGSRAGTARR